MTKDNQEKALATLRDLCDACEKIAQAYHSWFWPLSYSKANAQITMKVNQMTHIICNPDYELHNFAWELILAQQAVLRAYVSTLNPCHEKNVLETLLKQVSSPLLTACPPWHELIGNLNNLNTPNRASPFVTDLKTPVEALNYIPQKKEPISLWSMVVIIVKKIKAWFTKKPSVETCESVIYVAPVASPIEKLLPTPPSSIRTFREPGDTSQERRIRIAQGRRQKM